MSRAIDRKLRDLVAARANFVCEYCLIAESDAFFRFQVEHIISRKHGGMTAEENLAFSCVFCNLHKGTDIASMIPGKDVLVRLFDPRKDRWSGHFELDGLIIRSLTDIGEATVRILKMNHTDRIIERQTLSEQGRYPSEEALAYITEH